MTKHVSQREARRLRQTVRRLDAQIATIQARDAARASVWNSDYPGGVHVGGIETNEHWGAITLAQITTAQSLGCAVVVKLFGKVIKFYGVRT